MGSLPHGCVGATPSLPISSSSSLKTMYNKDRVAYDLLGGVTEYLCPTVLLSRKVVNRPSCKDLW